MSGWWVQWINPTIVCYPIDFASNAIVFSSFLLHKKCFHEIPTSQATPFTCSHSSPWWSAQKVRCSTQASTISVGDPRLPSINQLRLVKADGTFCQDGHGVWGWRVQFHKLPILISCLNLYSTVLYDSYNMGHYDKQYFFSTNVQPNLENMNNPFSRTWKT